MKRISFSSREVSSPIFLDLVIQLFHDLGKRTKSPEVGRTFLKRLIPKLSYILPPCSHSLGRRSQSRSRSRALPVLSPQPLGADPRRASSDAGCRSAVTDFSHTSTSVSFAAAG